MFIRNAALLTLAAFALAGCGRDDVKVYHVESGDSAAPTPPPVAPTAPAAMPTACARRAARAGQQRPAAGEICFARRLAGKNPSQMRVASFGISEDGKNADVSVIPLGGMAGGDPANVNRWRGQVGLQPLADDEIEKLAEKISVGEQPADLYDIGGGAQRILAVIFHRDNTVWFFKVTGDANLVEKQNPRSFHS